LAIGYGYVPKTYFETVVGTRKRTAWGKTLAVVSLNGDFPRLPMVECVGIGCSVTNSIGH
jgi:hypothetical protein